MNRRPAAVAAQTRARTLAALLAAVIAAAQTGSPPTDGRWTP